jgi:hypothetical protein
VLKRSNALVVVAVAVLAVSGVASPPVMPEADGSRSDELSSWSVSPSGEVEAPSIRLAAAAGYTINPHHYNVLGSNGTTSQRFNARDLALYLFDLDQGWSLSLNEACSADTLHLVDKSSRLSGRLFGETAANTNCGGGAEYGTAILTIGNVVGLGYEKQYTTQSVSGCNVAVSECRKMVCLQFDVYGLITTSCSTHLTPRRASDGSTEIPRKQANDYAYFSTIYAGSTFRIMSGDFNLLTNELPPTFYQNNRDGTYGNTFNVLTSLIYKFDYIWIQNGGGGSLVQGREAICSRRDASDHCYTVGTKYL